MEFYGIYSGNVVDNADGLQRGRLKVSVPTVFGPTVSGNITVADLPWAFPAGLPAGQGPDSGGIMWLPDINDRVMVMFLDGEPEKPVWFWGMADIDAMSGVLEYASQTSSGVTPSTSSSSTTAVTTASGKAPTSGASTTAGAPTQKGKFTRYGHELEFNPVGSIWTTKGGYGIVLTDSTTGQQNGSITIYTPLGGTFDISDNNIPPNSGTTLTIQMQQAYVNIFQEWEHWAQTFDFIASRGGAGQFGSVTSTSDSSPSQTGITSQQASSLNTSVTPFGIQADRIVLGYRSAPSATAPTFLSPVAGAPPGGTQGSAPSLTPLVRLSDMDSYTLFLTNWLDNLLTQRLTAYFQQWQSNFQLHTHSNGNNGSPTGPPLLPPPSWEVPAPTSKLYLQQNNLPTGSPIVFATKQS